MLIASPTFLYPLVLKVFPIEEGVLFCIPTPNLEIAFPKLFLALPIFESPLIFLPKFDIAFPTLDTTLLPPKLPAPQMIK